jgi:hypothetical protein
VEVDKTTGFFYVRRKGITATGLPIIEEKAKHKVQQLFTAFDAACAKHRELQKTGVKELFSNMRFINSVAEADDSITGIANIRMYFKPYLKINEKDGEAPVLESQMMVVVGRNYYITEVIYNLLPVKSTINANALPPMNDNKIQGISYLLHESRTLLTPYYTYEQL